MRTSAATPGVNSSTCAILKAESSGPPVINLCAGPPSPTRPSSRRTRPTFCRGRRHPDAPGNHGAAGTQCRSTSADPDEPEFQNPRPRSDELRRGGACHARGRRGPSGVRQTFSGNGMGRTHQALLARRRPRSAEQSPVWAVHVLAAEGPSEDTSYETDRARFLGRGRTPANPVALEAGAKSVRHDRTRARPRVQPAAASPAGSGGYLHIGLHDGPEREP